MFWEDFLVENGFAEQVVENKNKPIEETRNIVHTSLYPKTRSRKQQGAIVLEKKHHS